MCCIYFGNTSTHIEITIQFICTCIRTYWPKGHWVIYKPEYFTIYLMLCGSDDLWNPRWPLRVIPMNIYVPMYNNYTCILFYPTDSYPTDILQISMYISVVILQIWHLTEGNQQSTCGYFAHMWCPVEFAHYLKTHWLIHWLTHSLSWEWQSFLIVWNLFWGFLFYLQCLKCLTKGFSQKVKWNAQPRGSWFSWRSADVQLRCL